MSAPAQTVAPVGETQEREGMALTPEARAYYVDATLWKINVAWLLLGSVAGGLAMEVTENLMTLYMSSVGMSVSLIGFCQSINRWAVAFLVLYFSWKSDNCQMRMGRRKPFILLSLFPICLSLIALPHTRNVALVILLCAIFWFFLDMKMSTYPFLNWDISPKHRWGLMTGLNTAAYGVGRYLADVTVIPFSKTHGYVTAFLFAALIVGIPTLLLLFFLKEPPLRVKDPKPFRLVPVLKIGFSQKNNWALFTGFSLAAGSIAIPVVLFTLQLKIKGLDEQQIGQVLKWGSLVYFLLAPVAGMVVDQIGSFKTFLIGLAMYAVATILGIAGGSMLVFGICWALTKGALVLFGVSLIVFLIEGVPLTIIASFCACNAMISNAISAALISLSSVLVEKLGNHFQVGWILGFVLTLAGLPLLMFVVQQRRKQTPQIMALDTGRNVPAVEAG